MTPKALCRVVQGHENKCSSGMMISKPGIVTIGLSVSHSGASGIELHPWFQTGVITSLIRSATTRVSKVEAGVEDNVWLRGI